MPTLHDQLHDAVSDVTADLTTLTAAARRRGLAQRRRRRALSSVGAAAAALTIGVTAWALLPSGTSTGERTDPTTTSTTRPSTSPTASAAGTTRLTGRSSAAILLELVGARIPAAIENASIRGQGGIDLADDTGQVVLTAEQDADTFAQFTVLNTEGMSTVSVNVQHWSGGTDGLRTYQDDTDKPGTTMLVAELTSQERGLRVVVSAATATGTSAVLDQAQLAAIASDPVWGFTVPKEYAAKGDALTTYSWVLSLPDTHPVEHVHIPAPDVH